MKKNYLPLIFDSIFELLIFFIIPFIFLSFFISYNKTFIFSILISLTLTSLFFTLSVKKNKIRLVNRKEEKLKNQVFNQLDFLSKKERFTLFFNALKEKYDRVIEKNGSIIIEDEITLIYLAFSFDGVKKSDILKAFNYGKNYKKIIIFTSFCDKEVRDFSLKFKTPIIIEKRDKIYNLLKDTNNLPKITFTLVEQKYKIKFSDFVDRKKAVKFLLFGFTLYLLSFLVHYKIYYIICGSLFVILSLFCFFFGKKQEEDF